MKMELVIAAPVAGVVTAVTVAPGDRVALDQPLAHVEAAS
jgi:biotin carboxyl carrier protein